MTYHKIIEKDEASIYLIDLPQKITGFEHFLAAWLIQDRARDRTILFDCGPSSSIQYLLEDLARLKSKPDHLLLTHVHLDHGGGAGDLLTIFPHMKITAHRRGIKHLIDPSRLWEGSLAVLGTTAETYGKPVPVLEGSFAEVPEGIKELDTPGHAGHHLSFYTEPGGVKTLFPGEAAGVCVEDMAYTWLDGPVDEEMLYIRPATAPPFRYETTLSSIEKISQISCDIICPGHYGPIHSTGLMMERAAEQLKMWRELLLPLFRSGEKDTTELLDILIDKDPYLRCLNRFKQEVQTRERSFLKNSLRGFLNEFETTESKGE